MEFYKYYLENSQPTQPYNGEEALPLWGQGAGKEKK